MWIRSSVFIGALERNAELVGINSELRETKAANTATIDWMRSRINQLEKERAILMREVTHLNVPVPEIAREHPTNAMSPVIPPGMSLPSFEDVGDDAAAQLGITHDDHGELQYT